MIASVNQGEYDVVFMDWQMPEMDGIRATQEIRRCHQSPTQPWIIALTANALASQRQMCFDAGMNDYLSKPITLERLAQALLGIPYIAENVTTNPTAIAPGPPLNATLAPDTTQASVDPQIWAQLVQGMADEDIMAELISLFLEELTQQLEQLTKAIATEDYPQICAITHNLKGTAGTMGAKLLSDAASHLEIAAQQAQPEAIATNFSRLQHQATAVQIVLQEKQQKAKV
ncbi:MAG: response regulator [Synechococcus sp.]|nr:response regulator [Synechococcus sp.]